MFERFTDEGRSVIVWAQEETVSLRHKQIGTEHVLLGVLRTAEPQLQAAIRETGISAGSVRERLIESVGRGRKGPTGHIPFSQAAKQGLERSLRVSNDLGDAEIGPAHLLVAILQAPDCTAVRLLRSLNVDIGALGVVACDVASGDNSRAGEAELNPDQPTPNSPGWTESASKADTERTELARGLVQFAHHEPQCDPVHGCSCGLASLLAVAQTVLNRGR